MSNFLDRIKEGFENTVNNVKTALDLDKNGQVTFTEVLTPIAKAVSPWKGIEEQKAYLDEQQKKNGKITLGDRLRSRAVNPLSESPLLAPSVRLQAKLGEELIAKPFAAAAASTFLTGSAGQQEYKGRIAPSPLSKSVFGGVLAGQLTGEEPGEAYGIPQMFERANKGMGIIGDVAKFTAEKTGLPIGLFSAPLIGLGLGLDLTPIGGSDNLAAASVRIAGTQNPEEVLKILDRVFTGSAEARQVLAKLLAPIEDVQEVTRILREAEAARSAAPAVRELVRTTTGLSDEAIAESRALARSGFSDEAVAVARGASSADEVVQIAGSQADIARLARTNLARIDAGEDAAAVIRETTDLFTREIAERARGVVSFQDTLTAAARSNLTPEELAVLPKGTVLNAEQMTAARELAVAAAVEVSQAGRRFIDNPTIKTLEEFKAAKVANLQLQAASKAAGSEVARATGARRISIRPSTAAEERVRRFIEMQGITQRATGEKGEFEAELAFAKLLQNVGPDAKAIQNFLTEVSKPNWLDKIVEFSVAAKLWTPTTWLVNAVSNAMTAGLRPAEKVFAATADLMMNGFTKGAERERFFGEAFHDFYGMTAAFKLGVPDALRKYINTLSFGQFVKTLEDSGGAVGNFIHAIRTEEGMQAAGKGAEVATTSGGAIGGRTGKVVRTPFRILQASDQFFRTMNQTAELHSLAYRQVVQEGLKGDARIQRMAELIKAPSDEMLDAAQLKANEFLFQEELGGIMKSVEGLRAKHPATKFIVPFLKTPVNVATFSFRRSPMGLFSPKNFRDIMKGGGSRADAIARISIGTTLATYITLLAGEGKITGPAPEDEAERDKFYREGKLPYAVKLGDTWVQYQRLEPIASFFSLAANVQDKISRGAKEEEISSLASELILGISKHYVDQTFLIGLSDAMDAVTEGGVSAQRFMNGLVTGQIPSAIPWIARSLDRTIRQPEGLLETIQTKIPGLSQGVRARLDVFGNEVERPGGFIRETLPIKYSKESTDKVESELTRLGIEISFPNENITRSGHSVSLTADEHHELVSMTGRVTKAVLDKVVSTPAWEKLSDDDREDAINSIIQKVREPFQDQLFSEAETRRLKLDVPDTDLANDIIARVVTSDSYSELDDKTRKDLILRVLEKANVQ